MSIHTRSLKLIEFTLAGNSFECQVQTWNINNNSPLGERIYSFCPNGEDREESIPDYALDLRFYSDWRSGGVSDYLWDNGGVTVAFQLDHHPDIVGEHVRWTGSVQIVVPSVGGEVKSTEITAVTLPVLGTPVKTRP